MENDYCVYMHKCKINEKMYIGLTCNVNRRWRSNGIEYKPYKENTRPFWNAICKYGWDSFEHIILENNLSKIEAEQREKYYILKYNSRDKKCGYNVAEGGNGGRIYLEHPRGMKGKKHTDEWIKMIKEVNTGRNNGFVKSGGWVTHEHPKGMLGKNHTDKVKNSISNTLKSKKVNCKKILVIMPNNDEFIFDSKGEAAEFLGMCSTGSAFINCYKTGLPYKIKVKNQHTEKLKHLEGLIIKEFTENTEITTEIKESVAS